MADNEMLSDDLYQPLTDDELKRLDQFLIEQENENGIFCVSQLDGYLTAVVSGPETIPPSEWLDFMWGENGKANWKDAQECEDIFGLMFRQMNDISAVLMDAPMEFEPLFMERETENKTYTLVDEWCDGYLRGVVMRWEQWTEMPNLDDDYLAPIRMFATEWGWKQLDEMNDTEIEFWQRQIPVAVRRMHAYWLDKRRAHIATLIDQADDLSTFAEFDEPFVRTTPKIGRNDPCPCGSGKKYKKCCGMH